MGTGDLFGPKACFAAGEKRRVLLGVDFVHITLSFSIVFNRVIESTCLFWKYLHWRLLPRYYVAPRDGVQLMLGLDGEQ